jgi:cytochrome c
MKSARVEWNDKTLDEWIADPQRVIPGNQMTFAGIKDEKQRADVIAFLKQATEGGGSQMGQGMMGGMDGMGGMMGGGQASPKSLMPKIVSKQSLTAKTPMPSPPLTGKHANFGNAISA